MGRHRYTVYGFVLLAGLILALSIQSLEKGQPRSPSGRRETGTSFLPSRPAGSSQVVLGDLIVTVPQEWQIEEPSSAMRIGQFRLPGAGNGDDAELAVFSGIGGGAESNLNRWFGQFTQPDGSSSREQARVETFSIDDLEITIADLTGTFVGSGMAMSPSVNLPGYRLLAAIVGTSDDSYYFKLVGPQDTIARWAETFAKFIGSIRSGGS